jgi:hypothetical protein
LAESRTSPGRPVQIDINQCQKTSILSTSADASYPPTHLAFFLFTPMSPLSSNPSLSTGLSTIDPILLHPRQYNWTFPANGNQHQQSIPGSMGPNTISPQASVSDRRKTHSCIHEPRIPRPNISNAGISSRSYPRPVNAILPPRVMRHICGWNFLWRVSQTRRHNKRPRNALWRRKSFACNHGCRR